MILQKVTRFGYCILFILLSACSVGVSYTPPIIPIRISTSTGGEIEVALVGSVSTPIGVFEIEGSATIAQLKSKFQKRLFILRVDHQAAVAEIDPEQSFRVEYGDNTTMFRKVNLEHRSNGDIVLELETVAGDTTPKIKFLAISGDKPEPYYPCPGAPPSLIRTGSTVRVCTQSDHLIVHTTASFKSDTVRRMAPGEQMSVIGGPVCGNDSVWWQVKLENGWKGWAIEGGDAVDPYFLCLSY